MPNIAQERRQAAEYLRLARAALRTMDTQIEKQERLLKRIANRKSKIPDAKDANDILTVNDGLIQAYDNWNRAGTELVLFLRA